MPSFFLTIPGAVTAIGVVVLVAHGRMSARTEGARLAEARQREGGPRGTSPRLKMQIVISLVVLATALYVVIARPEASDDHKWAYAIIGTIVGYWLRT